MSRLMLFALLVVFAAPTQAQTFSGAASVIDGDTLEIHGQRIRIHGIDAPESYQICYRPEAYRCGQKAALALDDWLRVNRPVVCKTIDIDRYDRVVARCKAGDKDVAEWLVENGHALDWPRYSDGEYSGAQSRAQEDRRGMWTGQFQLPWERRRNKEAPLVN